MKTFTPFLIIKVLQFLIIKVLQLMQKTTLLIGLFLSISLPIFSQQKVGEAAHEEPKALNTETFNFLELAKKQEAGLLPPPPVKDPKPPKNLGIQGNNPLPLGFEKAIEAPTPPLLNIPSPNPDLTFLGLNQGSFGINPADVGGTVGPNHVMTALNSEVCIRDKSGTLISKVTLANFVGTTNFAFDPKVVYDPYNQRWIFSACSTANPISILEMKVSATNDPTGNWHTYHLDVDATNIDWFDYPSMGFNKDWIVVSGNMFSWAGISKGAKTYILKKSDMYAGLSATTYTMTHSTIGTLVPATTYDNTLNKVYLLSQWNASSGALGLYEISGVPPATPTYSAAAIVNPTAQAWSQTVVNAPQLGSTEKINTGDTRMQSLTYRNGYLWATHTAYLPATSPNRSAVQWWQINPTSTSNTGCVTQFGRIDDPTGNIFCTFPSLAVNVDNTVMISYAVFSANIYPSTSYHVRYSSDPSGTMRDGVTFRNGTAKYDNGGTGASRWGDYSAATVDPVNDKDFWTQQVVSALPISGVDKWETYWTKIIMCPVASQPYGFSSFSANVCKGQNNVFYSVPSVSGATSYTWKFSGTGASFSSTSNSLYINFSSIATNGTLSVVANNACGASSARSLSISVNDIPSTVSVSGGGTVCNSTTITASGGAGGTMYFQGTNSNGTSFATLSSSQTITSSGTYYFRAYNSCGWSTKGSATVNIGTIPAAVTVPGGGNFCNAVILNASGGAGGNIYFQGINSNGTSTAKPSSSQTVTTSGTYYFRAYNSCGWGQQGSVTVTVNYDPSAVSVSGGGPVCNSATITASGGAGGTMYFQGTNSNGTSTATPSSSQTVTSSGTYYFRAYNSCGWGSQGSTTVTINTVPSVVSGSGSGTFCNNATITASGGSGGTIYFQGTTSGGTSLTTPSTSQSVNASGTYYFRPYNSCSWGTQGSVNVIINTIPGAVSISGGEVLTVCNSTTLNATGGNGGTIYWQNTVNGGTSLANPSTSQGVGSSGTYYFRANNACGWGTQAGIALTVIPSPSAVSVSGGGSFCTNTTLHATGGGGTTYFQGNTSGGTSTAIPTTSRLINTSGTYYFRSNNACGWGTEGSAVVNIYSANLTLIGNATSGTQRSSQHIISRQTIPLGANVIYQAAQSITLEATPTQGMFIAPIGSVFKAEIKSCSN